MEITLKPVATVRNSRKIPSDDYWNEIISEIELEEHIPAEAFERISDFSHLEVIYYFHKAEKGNIVFSGHPRENPDYPDVGIFGQRKKDRPNAMRVLQGKMLISINRINTFRGFELYNC